MTKPNFINYDVLKVNDVFKTSTEKFINDFSEFIKIKNDIINSILLIVSNEIDEILLQEKNIEAIIIQKEHRIVSNNVLIRYKKQNESKTQNITINQLSKYFYDNNYNKDNSINEKLINRLLEIEKMVKTNIYKYALWNRMGNDDVVNFKTAIDKNGTLFLNGCKKNNEIHSLVNDEFKKTKFKFYDLESIKEFEEKILNFISDFLIPFYLKEGLKLKEDLKKENVITNFSFGLVVPYRYLKLTTSVNAKYKEKMFKYNDSRKQSKYCGEGDESKKINNFIVFFENIFEDDIIIMALKSYYIKVMKEKNKISKATGKLLPQFTAKISNIKHAKKFLLNDDYKKFEAAILDDKLPIIDPPSTIKQKYSI